MKLMKSNDNKQLKKFNLSLPLHRQDEQHWLWPCERTKFLLSDKTFLLTREQEPKIYLELNQIKLILATQYESQDSITEDYQ